ncbi:Scaffold-type E3 ligase [Varicellaria rhodocarpa]|nr:Scaffold-type E3 ligase [Varicellaria rhodocarpa]
MFVQNSHFPNVITPQTATNSNLNTLFDLYRDASSGSADLLGVEGTIKYLGDLGIQLDEVAVLAVLTELAAPTMGELTRQGFLDGWKNDQADSIPKQQAKVNHFRATISTDQRLFTRVYKHTFILARNPGQKSVQLDAAIEYWRLLLTAPSVNWDTPATPWLAWWIEYLEAHWKKSISKDTWDMTMKFVAESLKDETMGFWNEDGAWPSVIDDFVRFVKEKRASAGAA